MASIIRAASTKNGDAKDILAFSNSNDVKERRNITIKLSLDEGIKDLYFVRVPLKDVLKD